MRIFSYRYDLAARRRLARAPDPDESRGLGSRCPAPLRIEGAAVSVWESLDTPRRIDGVVAVLARHGADGEVLAGDVAWTLHALAAAGLVESA